MIYSQLAWNRNHKIYIYNRIYIYVCMYVFFRWGISHVMGFNAKSGLMSWMIWGTPCQETSVYSQITYGTEPLLDMLTPKFCIGYILLYIYIHIVTPNWTNLCLKQNYSKMCSCRVSCYFPVVVCLNGLSTSIARLIISILWVVPNQPLYFFQKTSVVFFFPSRSMSIVKKRGVVPLEILLAT